jgi:hypothetical protein
MFSGITFCHPRVGEENTLDLVHLGRFHLPPVSWVLSWFQHILHIL